MKPNYYSLVNQGTDCKSKLQRSAETHQQLWTTGWPLWGIWILQPLLVVLLQRLVREQAGINQTVNQPQSSCTKQSRGSKQSQKLL